MVQNSRKLLTVDEREREYSSHSDYYADETLLALTRALGDYLALIAPKDHANEAMSALVRPLIDIADVSAEESKDWRAVALRAHGSGFTEWPIGSLIFQMGAYAQFGIILSTNRGGDSERRKFLQESVERLCAFFDRSPIGLWGIAPNNDLAKLVLLVRGRWALDNGEPLEPAALALFGGVSEGTMRNMTSGQNRKFNLVDGRIPTQEALAWLSEREDFLPSIWERSDQPEYGLKREEPIDDAVFLPVSRDGSVFHPGEGRGSRYTIGQKGAEQQIDGFDEALKALQCMPTPQWRRPNENGNWGIVSGVRWARFDRAELEAIARTPAFRLPADR